MRRTTLLIASAHAAAPLNKCSIWRQSLFVATIVALQSQQVGKSRGRRLSRQQSACRPGPHCLTAAQVRQRGQGITSRPAGDEGDRPSTTAVQGPPAQANQVSTRRLSLRRLSVEAGRVALAGGGREAEAGLAAHQAQV